MTRARKRVSAPAYNLARKAWYKWHPGLQKTIYVAGDVSADEAMRAWQAILKQGVVKSARWDAGATVRALCGRYGRQRHADAKAGRVSASHYSSIAQVLKHLSQALGERALLDVTPDDWTEYARSLDRLAISSRRRFRAILLTMFRHAEDEDWIDRVPKFGRAFRKLASTKGRTKIDPFTHDECLKIYAAIDEKTRTVFATTRTGGRALIPHRNLKAAFLLAINGGLTPIDLGTLKEADVDWRGGFIRTDRHKTGMQRVVPLWHETLCAMRDAYQHGELLLVTREGYPVAHQAVNDKGTVNLVDSISDAFRKAMARAGVVRPGKGLSRLRHTCRTIVSEAGDESAADVLAGHSLPGMRAVYVTVTDERLRRAADHVHDWLFTPLVEP